MNFVSQCVRSMLLKFCMLLFLVVSGFAHLYDEAVEKDEQVRALLIQPHGRDTELFNTMQSLSNCYKLVTGLLHARNSSTISLARKLNDRGVPRFLLEHFYLKDIISFYNWYEEELQLFHSHYSEVQSSWREFEATFRNVSYLCDRIRLDKQ